jgi:periplasmic protein TonB
MYEHSLLSSRRRSKSRVLLAPVAIAVHAVVLGGVAVGQYWSVPAVAEPSIPVSFVTALAPPPPPPAGPPPAPEPRHSEQSAPVEIAMEPVQPITIPSEIPPVPDQPLYASIPGAVPGGLPNGVPNGSRDGMPNGVPYGVPHGLPDGRAAAGDRIIDVAGDVVKPEVVTRVQPIYTEIARRAHIQGVVIVETIIDTRGNVTDARVLKSLPMGLSEAAVDAVRQWRFRPATLDGRPVSVYFTLTVNFELQ